MGAEGNNGQGPCVLIYHSKLLMFLNHEKVSKTISIVIFVREYNKFSSLLLTRAKVIKTIVRLRIWKNNESYKFTLLSCKTMILKAVIVIVRIKDNFIRLISAKYPRYQSMTLCIIYK